MPGLYTFKLNIAWHIHAFRSHTQLDIHPLCVSGEDIQDMICSTDECQFADVVPELFVIETLELHSEGSDILDNPEIADFLGKGENVILGCGGVRGFYHNAFCFSPQ